MKHVLIALVVSMMLFSCGNKKVKDENKSSFELKGKLDFSNGEQLYLEELSSTGMKVIDTTTVDKNGEFAFMHANPSLGFYRVRITDANFAMLVLDSSEKVTLKGDARNLGLSFSVEGSPDSKLFAEVNNTSKGSYQKRDSMMHTYEVFANLNKNDKAKVQSYGNEAEKAFNEEAHSLNKYLLDFIDKNTASLVAIVALQQLTPEADKDEFIGLYKKIDSALTKKYPASVQVKQFHEKTLNVLKSSVGSVAPEFSLDTPDGKKAGPSSFKGKLLLIDFWASWCRPCREENPSMVKAYKKYHSKGIEFLGVSLDKDKSKWTQAIEHDKLEWTQVSDLAGWQSEAARLYTVTSIPQTVLIDKDGKIIAKGLVEEALQTRLEGLLK